MTIIEIVGLITGSGIVGALIKSWAERKQTHAGIIKLKNESGQIVLEGEIKVTEFYKEQLDAILKKYDVLASRLDQEVKEKQEWEQKFNTLEKKYQDLQRQFTLFKSLASKNNEDN